MSALLENKPALLSTLIANPPRRSSAIPSRGRELVVFAAAFLALVLAQLVFSDSLSLFSRHYWFDEFLTQDLVADPDWGHSLRALQSGVETHPPALHLVLRICTLGGRFANETTLRLFAFGFVLAAVLGIYVSLRDSFAPLPCLAACLAVWSHPQIMTQVFEARGYGAWLAGAVWYAYLLRLARGRRGLWPKVGLAVLALFVCTVHYFGILSLVLVTAFELLAHRPDGDSRFLDILPAGLGPIGLAACLPLLLGQRAAFTVPTWVPPPTLERAADFVLALLFPTALAVVPVAVWLATLTRPHGDNNEEADPPGELSPLAGLTGLAFLPLVLVAFSFTVQSVLVDRYGLAAVAALAPVVAFAIARVSRGWIVGVCGVLVLLGGREMDSLAAKYRYRDWKSGELIALLASPQVEGVVVFENAHPFVVVRRYAAPEHARRCFLLDFEPGDPPSGESNLFARDLVRQYARSFQTPLQLHWSEVRSLSRFYLVADRVRSPGEGFEEAYPGFQARLVSGQVYEMVARPDFSQP